MLQINSKTNQIKSLRRYLTLYEINTRYFINIHTHTTHTQTHTNTHKHTHKHTLTQTHAHKHTHTHTNTLEAFEEKINLHYK